MSDKPTTYLQDCLMEPGQATMVSGMLKSDPRFKSMGITINPDRETYDPLQAESIPEGQVLVTLW